MNTDDCFRHFFLDTTNQTQLTSYIDQTASHILQPFPVGLSSNVGLFVANPAYAGDAGFATGFSKTDYHGTVVWSWQLAMMGAGLARQLGRCARDDAPGKLLMFSCMINSADALFQNSAQTPRFMIRLFVLTTACGIPLMPTAISSAMKSGAGSTITDSRWRSLAR